MSIWRGWSAVFLLCIGASSASADEGMWTFNNFPSAKVGAAYGFAPDAAWLDHLRLASVRIAGGCSASIVSPTGLVMTNHHCARGCIDAVSVSTGVDHVHDGFLARTPEAEQRCQGMELNQLVEISNVTASIGDATRGIGPGRFGAAQKAAMAEIEKRCATSAEFRCEVVALYHGGRYDLYRYRRLQDVRLVFAPEERIAFFGGDPDNFTFPRYDLDVTFLRIHGADGRPLATPDFLAWSDGTLREGDLTFVSGNPGRTSREMTVAQFDDERDRALPKSMNFSSELRGVLTEYRRRGEAQSRQATDLLFGVENRLKAQKGRHAALATGAFHARLVANETAFRARVAADPALQQKYGDVWQRIEALTPIDQDGRIEFDALERARVSKLFEIARSLLRYGDEIGKPNGERLREYSDARLPQFRQRLLADWPIHPELEIATLGWSLTKMREDLGPDHPAVKRALGLKSPLEVATAAVNGSALKDIRVDARGEAVGGARKALLDGGPSGIRASHDPMIELARAIDPDARRVRLRQETEVDGPLAQQQERLAQARFAALGETTYPDATFTLRLSYGAVSGYRENGAQVAPFTRIGGAYERHTGAEPFELPESWLAAKSRLDPALPMNFVTTNDIIGGNSGSPLVNRAGEIVGIAFDGNIQSLGGDYGYDPLQNRTVAVHSAAMLEALTKVYGAEALVEELRRPAAGASVSR